MRLPKRSRRFSNSFCACVTRASTCWRVRSTWPRRSSLPHPDRASTRRAASAAGRSRRIIGQGLPVGGGGTPVVLGAVALGGVVGGAPRLGGGVVLARGVLRRAPRLRGILLAGGVLRVRRVLALAF